MFSQISNGVIPRVTPISIVNSSGRLGVLSTSEPNHAVMLLVWYSFSVVLNASIFCLPRRLSLREPFAHVQIKSPRVMLSQCCHFRVTCRLWKEAALGTESCSELYSLFLALMLSMCVKSCRPRSKVHFCEHCTCVHMYTEASEFFAVQSHVVMFSVPELPVVLIASAFVHADDIH